MADFEKSFAKVLRYEGGTANDPNDRGGETYCGISRRWHPKWPGWLLLARMRADPTFLATSQLEQAVRDFYRTQFWARARGDDLPDQKLADELMDIAVNLGHGRAVTFLQRGLNILNDRQRLYPDIRTDGRFGVETMRALTSMMAVRPIRYLLTVLNILQGAHYVEQMESDDVQERFVGWLDRVELLHR